MSLKKFIIKIFFVFLLISISGCAVGISNSYVLSSQEELTNAHHQYKVAAVNGIGIGLNRLIKDVALRYNVDAYDYEPSPNTISKYKDYDYLLIIKRQLTKYPGSENPFVFAFKFLALLFGGIIPITESSEYYYSLTLLEGKNKVIIQEFSSTATTGRKVIWLPFIVTLGLLEKKSSATVEAADKVMVEDLLKSATNYLNNK